MSDFTKTLRTQRWDDHRYYHLSRINQTLHLISACSFLVAYVMLYIDPPVAALIGWLVSMVTRQSGHIFFEPRGFDTLNQASYEHKEEIKVGFNMQRKYILLSIWASIPMVLWLQPSLWGLLTPPETFSGFAHNVGWLWLWLAVAGILFRVTQLAVQQSVGTGIAWATKILTDPFNDIRTYWKSPFYLLKGELISRPEHLEAERLEHEAALARM